MDQVCGGLDANPRFQLPVERWVRCPITPISTRYEDKEGPQIPSVMWGEDEMTCFANGLLMPEGPIARPDGGLLLVEVLGGRLSRLGPDGARTTLSLIHI